MGISILSLFQTLLHFQETKEGWGEGGKAISLTDITNTEWQREIKITLTEREAFLMPLSSLHSLLPTKTTQGGSSLGETPKYENERDLVQPQTATPVSPDREQSWLEMGGKR